MKKKIEIISKEEIKWLSKNVKIKPNYSKCTDCPFGILKFKAMSVKSVVKHKNGQAIVYKTVNYQISPRL